MTFEDASWVRPSRCDNSSGNCVEVRVGEDVAMRNSADPEGPVLSFSREEWATFTAGVRAGEF